MCVICNEIMAMVKSDQVRCQYEAKKIMIQIMTARASNKDCCRVAGVLGEQSNFV